MSVTLYTVSLTGECCRPVDIFGVQLDRYRYWQYRWVPVSADICLASVPIPVVRLPVSTVNTVACTLIVSSL